MYRTLPPPPHFSLPPPPMPSSDIFDIEMVSQLTCSSIRLEYRQAMISSHLILFASASVIIAILLFIISLIWLRSSRTQEKSYNNNYHLKLTPKSASIDLINDCSTYSSQSYETVSSNHMGIYLESVDTSATTCSTDTMGAIYNECYWQHRLEPAHYYQILNMPDIVPN